MNHIINAIFREDGTLSDCVMATIIERVGSAPRSSGSRMLIFPDGAIRGSIGGGKLESEVMQYGGVMASDSRIQSATAQFNFSGQDASSMEMICGGSVRVLFEKISNSDLDKKKIFEAIRRNINLRDQSWLIVELDEKNFATKWNLIDDEANGSIEDLSFDEIRKVSTNRRIVREGQVYYIECISAPNRVLLFGAGHVGQAVAQVGALAEYEFVVVDDRPEFANPQRFPQAARIVVTEKIETAIDPSEVHPNDNIVIITRGHLHDEDVLQWALQTRAHYIGMIGSRRKWKLLKEDLSAKGYDPQRLDQVHSPIGLEIGAETPGEIAVSIVAELIKNQRG